MNNQTYDAAIQAIGGIPMPLGDFPALSRRNLPSARPIARGYCSASRPLPSRNIAAALLVGLGTRLGAL
jgi:hypothetical protein